ncbi:MAG: type II toxin-antitoxin system YoeB family toxin [Dysgonamonadaceae bacterium]|nr:type II toxin-antitoxin system YoeB family toxin [Dysgonamonadaceae bacterium]
MLVAGDNITYSRRISANNRIIYDIYDDIVTVLILFIERHYDESNA